MSKKKLLALLLSVVMTFSLAAPALAAEGEDAATPYEVPADVAGKLVILHTNDTHGADKAAEGKSIGTAGVAALKEAFEAAGAQVLLLSAGDATQGTPLVNYNQGSDAVRFLSAAGYDAMAPGNHEFDWGAENLFKILDENEPEFATLSANLLDEEGKPVFLTNQIFEMDGLKVGVFGLTTPEAATKTNPEKIQGLTFLAGDELYACAEAQVKELTEAGCDLIVALGHLGVDEETAATGNRSVDLCNKVAGIDLFVDGHSHTEMVEGKPVNADSYPSYENDSDTLIVSTGTKLANVGVVIYDQQTDTLTADLVTAAEWTQVDETVAKLVNDTQASVEDALKAVIGRTEVALNGERNPGVRTQETNLGDFATDALLWFAKKDQGDHVVAAITNGGGIRATIPEGDISMMTMNTVFPFGNTVVTLDLTGQQLLETLEAATYCLPTAIGAFPQVAGIEFTINTALPYENGEAYGTYFRCANPGTRVTNVTVDGQPLDLKATYTVATNDFSAVGGDTYYAFKDAKATMKDTGIPLDQALSEYVNEVLGGTITAEKYGEAAGRITIEYRPADLDVNAWWYEAAVICLDTKIMKGTDKGFDADAKVTEATVLQTFYNAENAPAVENGTLTDVEGKWYADAANWAASVGMVEGTEFGEDAVITRGEIKDLLDIYCELTGVNGEGLMKGNENGDMMLDKELSRAEFAQVWLNLTLAMMAAEEAA